jgi:hypothetical protein
MGRRGRDRVVVGITTTYVISAYILFMLWPMEHALIDYIDDRDIRPTFCSAMYLKNVFRNTKRDVILCFRIRVSINVSFNNISIKRIAWNVLWSFLL